MSIYTFSPHRICAAVLGRVGFSNASYTSSDVEIAERGHSCLPRQRKVAKLLDEPRGCRTAGHASSCPGVFVRCCYHPPARSLRLALRGPRAYGINLHGKNFRARDPQIGLRLVLPLEPLVKVAGPEFTAFRNSKLSEYDFRH